MATSAEEYKKAVHEDVTLPSGHVFTLREPTMESIIMYLDELGLQVGQEPSDDTMEKLKAYGINRESVAAIKHLIPSAIVSPIVVISSPGPDEIELGDIKSADLRVILDWVYKRLGIDEEGLKAQSFPVP